jgi:hypothetical protein
MRLGWLAPKGEADCGNHEWYKYTEAEDRCYHCKVGVHPTQFDEPEGITYLRYHSTVRTFRQHGPEWLHPFTWRLLGLANRVLGLGPRSERARWRLEDLVLEWKDGPPPRHV